ncbi:hypothetical protein M8J77_007073 [Diaphorina citri]|nr:hypothetical protein M8J77_007073 [Diaphorina citri]
MCSNNSGCGTNEDLIPEEEKLEIKADKLCPRCNTNNGEVVLRLKDIYCKACLLQYLNHKFRAALGKSKMMRPQDKVLVAFSGSHSSMALLHLLQEGMQLSSHKRILFSVCAIYIDDCSISQVSISERKANNAQIATAMKYFDSYFTCLEQALEPDNMKLYTDVTELPLEQFAKDSEIYKLFQTVTTLSSRQYLLQTLRQNLLLQAAKKLNCTKIFTAETQTDLATKIIANISLGKGAHVPLDVGFSDDRTGDIITLRPLRDFSSKEVIYYNIFNDLSPVHVPSLATLADPLASLQKAAESFVTDLQTNFPSTVSTVFRTADKLSLDLTSMNVNNTCLLCKAPLDTRADLASSSMGATRFSRYVSNATREQLSHVNISSESPDHASKVTTDVNQTVGSQDIPEKSVNGSEDISNQIVIGMQYTLNEKVSRTEDNEGPDNLQRSLCYACQYVVKDMTSDKDIGEGILKKCLQEKSLNEMEDQIRDFLL